MKSWAEIPARVPAGLAPGSQRRGDLDAFQRVLERLGETRTVHITGGPARLPASIGLATAAAAGGRRVALVEADLGRPGLAESLGLARSPGLAEFLRGEHEAARILQPLALAGPGAHRAQEPLVCAVAGEAVADPTALLASMPFALALEGLREAYDLVVLAGPALEEEGAAAVVAAGAGRTLAVCRKRGVPRRMRRHVDAVLVPSAADQRS